MGSLFIRCFYEFHRSQQNNIFKTLRLAYKFRLKLFNTLFSTCKVALHLLYYARLCEAERLEHDKIYQ